MGRSYSIALSARIATGGITSHNVHEGQGEIKMEKSSTKKRDMEGLYTLTKLPANTKESSFLRNSNFDFIVKRRSQSKIDSGSHEFYLMLRGENNLFRYMSSLIANPETENLFDFDIRPQDSLSGSHEFYRLSFDPIEGTAKVTQKLLA